MFTSDQIIQMPAEIQAKWVEDVQKFYESYKLACTKVREKGIEAKLSDPKNQYAPKYAMRSWQQVAELAVPVFQENGIVIAIECPPASPTHEDGKFVVHGTFYAIYGIARIQLYSGTQILFAPTQTSKAGNLMMDDKQANIAMRYLWKNFYLHLSGAADGETDGDEIATPETGQPKSRFTNSQTPALVNVRDHWESQKRALVEGGFYETLESVADAAKSLSSNGKLPDSVPAIDVLVAKLKTKSGK